MKVSSQIRTLCSSHPYINWIIYLLFSHLNRLTLPYSGIFIEKYFTWAPPPPPLPPENKTTISEKETNLSSDSKINIDYSLSIPLIEFKCVYFPLQINSHANNESFAWILPITYSNWLKFIQMCVGKKKNKWNNNSNLGLWTPVKMFAIRKNPLLRMELYLV